MFRGGSGVDTDHLPDPGGVRLRGQGLRRPGQAAPVAQLQPRPQADACASTSWGRPRIRDLQPFTLEGKITGFSDVILPARALSIFKGSNDSEIITAHPDYRVMIYGRGGADVMTGSDEPDRLDGGQGFDIARGRGGNDTCKAAEKRSSC